MTTTGLDVFDKTIHVTNAWLAEIMKTLSPDRQVAWHALGAVLRTVRDRIPVGLSAHLAAQLPLLVRGTYFDQWRPSEQPVNWRSLDEFLALLSDQLGNTRPVNPNTMIRDVARKMRADNVGALPVGGERPLGGDGDGPRYRGPGRGRRTHRRRISRGASPRLSLPVEHYAVLPVWS